MTKIQNRCWTLFFTFLIVGTFWSFYSLISKEIPDIERPLIFLCTDLNQNLKRSMIQSIAQANQSITMLSYSLSDREVIESLRQAASRGVKVEVFADQNAARSTKNKLSPDIALYYRGKDGLMHHKILIIDEKIVWMGSANFSFASLRRHNNLNVGLFSPDMAQKILTKVNGWKKGIYRSLEDETFSIGTHEVTLVMLPDSTHSEKTIISLLREAKKTIQVAMYTFTRHDLSHELIKAKERGVNVEVYLDKSMAEGAGRHIMEKLKQAQITTILSNGQGLLHHKMALIDHRKLILGSANWTLAAFERNDDNFLIIDHITKKEAKYFENIFTRLKHLEA